MHPNERYTFLVTVFRSPLFVAVAIRVVSRYIATNPISTTSVFSSNREENMRRTFCVSVLLLMAVSIFDTAAALPRFASRTGAKCQSCHINPSGGGMRQVFGVQYGRDELPVPTWSEEFGLDDFSTKLSDFVSIGADFRTLFFYQEKTEANAFFQMQGNIYTNFRIAKKVNMYLSKGLYSGFEVFGLLNILPADGFVKVGKFIPNYGLKMDDHRFFIRQETGFSPERGRAELAGGEIGLSPGHVTVTGGLYNSSEIGSTPTGNRNKALLGKVEGILPLEGGVNIGLGGNVFTRRNIQDLRTTVFGGYGSFSFKNITVLAEGDFIRNTGPGATKDSTGVVMFVECDYVVTPGLDLKVAFDYFDPDKDLKSGSVSRFSFGFEFFPITGVEVRPIYRVVDNKKATFEANEFDLLVHFYF